jgi:hypothetical protein
MTSRTCTGWLLTAAWLLTASVAARQGTIPAPRLNAEQKMRAQSLVKLITDVHAEKMSAPSDVTLSWQGFFFAAENNLVYVPYTIGIDGKFTNMPLALYVRVLTKDALPPSYDPSKTTTLRSYLGQMSVVNDTRDLRDGRVDATGIVAEDIHFFEMPKDGRLTRGLWLPPGEYKVFIGMQEKAGGKNPPRTAVLEQALVVPDLTRGLGISSVVLASSVEPADPGARRQNQLENPYSIGGTRITPALSTRLPRSGELTAVFFIYHTSERAAGKPDVEAEYVFYERVGDRGEVIFRKSPSQLFNGETLPAAFSVGAGQYILGGLAVGLSAFPVGQYRLDVKVTDKVTHESTSGSLNFSVYND